MNDQFVILLNKSYLNSGKPRNSGQFMADQTFHYIESTLYMIYLPYPTTTLIPPTSRFPNSRFSLTRGFLSAISLQIRGLRLSNSRFLRIFVFCITRDVEELKMSTLMSGTLPTDPNFFEFSRSRAYVIKSIYQILITLR